MRAPLLPPTPPATLPAPHLARPGGDPQPAAGKAGICPVCGADITVDGRFVTRECGHGVLATAAGVLVAASENTAVTRRVMSTWAYGHLAKAPGSEWKTAIIESTVTRVAPGRTELVN